jgi:glycine/betaine/sarcosine/D-proline reductase family selenoprotein B
MPVLAANAGANRVVRGVRIEHICGNPALSPDEDEQLMLKIVETALEALKTSVAKPTIFDSLAEQKEATGVPA